MKFLPFSSIERLTDAATGLLVESLQSQRTPSSATMLSGGKTPLEAYRRVAASGVVASSCARVLFSDERMTPENSPDSNYGNALPMLDALGLDANRVMRVRTLLTLEAAAEDYDRQLRALLDAHGVLSLGLLGLGADGHTASLFSDADLERAEGRYAIAVPKAGGLDRVSVTPSLLARFERIVFLVAGPDKTDILNLMSSHPEAVVAAKAVAAAPHVEIWTA